MRSGFGDSLSDYSLKSTTDTCVAETPKLQSIIEYLKNQSERLYMITGNLQEKLNKVSEINCSNQNSLKSEPGKEPGDAVGIIFNLIDQVNRNTTRLEELDKHLSTLI